MALHRELCVGYYLMETVAADLKAGDALVVNAANGAVGQVVIQLCRLMNIRAVAICRRHDNFGDTKAWLEFLGAYKVFADDEPIVPALQREYASLPRLAFDGVGGRAAKARRSRSRATTFKNDDASMFNAAKMITDGLPLLSSWVRGRGDGPRRSAASGRSSSSAR